MFYSKQMMLRDFTICENITLILLRNKILKLQTIFITIVDIYSKSCLRLTSITN